MCFRYGACFEPSWFWSVNMGSARETSQISQKRADEHFPPFCELAKICTSRCKPESCPTLQRRDWSYTCTIRIFHSSDTLFIPTETNRDALVDQSPHATIHGRKPVRRVPFLIRGLQVCLLRGRSELNAIAVRSQTVHPCSGKVHAEIGPCV